MVKIANLMNCVPGHDILGIQQYKYLLSALKVIGSNCNPLQCNNRVKIANFPFLDTNTLHPKKEIPVIGTLLKDPNRYSRLYEEFPGKKAPRRPLLYRERRGCSGGHWIPGIMVLGSGSRHQPMLTSANEPVATSAYGSGSNFVTSILPNLEIVTAGPKNS
ncbi:hypothetical protein B0H14DRAFT_2648433 [Mycena olivaceomarginata]|nr:hypothetical protein B0H14DRAFT_2648433 [Mycena olivaceomarginata]